MMPGFPNFRMGDLWLRSQKNRRSQDCMAVFLPAFPLLSLLSFTSNFLSLFPKKTDGSYHVLQKAQEFALWPVLGVQKEVRSSDVFLHF